MPQNGKGRLDPRVHVALRVDVQYPFGGSHWGRGETIDLSASGTYVRSEVVIPLKAQIGCRIYLPPAGGEPDHLIDTEAVVVRTESPERGTQEWRYAVYFLNLPDLDLRALRRFIYATA